jgi:UDPglucose--hexose-1-phosphate uridylyltransferase
MFSQPLTKPDGRGLTLYARRPFAPVAAAPSPVSEPHRPNAHLRWHPLREEWVAYAGHRQHRTFLPPKEFNPLAPTLDEAHPTELPAGDYDIAVFENLFPTLTPLAHDPPAAIVDTRPALGACEVVVFSQDAQGTLGGLPLWQLELLLEVWADRTRVLGARDEVQYVFPFENRGVEVGVTLQHPHGQIYAYPVVPPIPARELEAQRRYHDAHGRGLLEDLLARETSERSRIVYGGDAAVALVPVCARYAYEAWVAPRRGAPSLVDLDAGERQDLARALKTLLLKYDALWGRPFPYVLVCHQAPTDGRPHPEAHVHFECYPAYRMRDRLKYLAGSELGAGVFTADTLPEATARELQQVEVTLS